MEESKKKTNFFKEALKSIKDLDKYEDFALELPKNSFKYFLKLVLVFAVIITLFYSYKMVTNLNEIYSGLKQSIPEFSYSQGNLNTDIQEPVYINGYEDIIGKIIIDTNLEDIQTDKYEEIIKENGVVILALKDKVIITGNKTSGQLMYKYTDIAGRYNITELTKQDVVNYIEGINIVSIYSSIYFIIFIYLFIVYFISIFIDVFILAILTYIIARISRIRLKFGPAFNVAVHGITLPVVLNLVYIIVNLLTGFTIKYFGLMYNTISYIYIIVAILMIKTDFINRQLELIKLAAEEQEKVRQELEKQKEEEKKKKEAEKEKQPKEKKPRENTKKKKQKEDNDGLEGEVNPSVIQEKQ